MKLSEIKGARALTVLADLIDPMSEIIQDEQFKALLKTKEKAKIAKYLLTNHNTNVIKVLALINGEDPATYEPSLLSLPLMLIELMNDPDVINLFGSQDQTTESASSGPAMENTEAK